MRLHTDCWTARVAQPAAAIPVMLSASCPRLPQISYGTPNANPRATLPAAGTVVTEMKTPDKPPTLAEVKDKTPGCCGNDGDDERPLVRGVDERGVGPGCGDLLDGDPTEPRGRRAPPTS